MRRGTLITLLALLLVLAVAAAWQISLARRDLGPYPGPVEGTPLPVGPGEG